MSNTTTVILTIPFPDSHPWEVETGLVELGFARPQQEPKVWLMFDVKLGGGGIEWLRERVMELPWPRRSVPTHLEVLWMDDHTTEDDSMQGRVAPYAWESATWRLP